MALTPDKTDSPLIIDPNRVLPFPIASQCFQLISRRRSQNAQLVRRLNLEQFPGVSPNTLTFRKRYADAPYDLRKARVTSESIESGIHPDPDQSSRAVSVGLLKPIHGSIFLAESERDNAHVISANIGLAAGVHKRSEHFPGLLFLPCHRIRIDGFVRHACSTELYCAVGRVHGFGMVRKKGLSDGQPCIGAVSVGLQFDIAATELHSFAIPLRTK